MTQAVMEYLAERRKNWLEKRLSADTDEAAKLELETEANEKFSLAQWLPDAARRAGHLSMVSHPSKFSHPSAKTSAVIAQASLQADGYVRTGNVSYPLDVFGSAAAIDVYKFLALSLSDGKTVLEHLEQETALAQQLLSQASSVPVSELTSQFLAIKASETQVKTDGLVKQVYFPVDGGYHLLSILTPSGMLTELKERIDAMRFSDESKAAREARKNQLYHDQGFNDILDLTVTVYGGSKPQNISVLNNQNSGRSYLLPCKPPQLDHRATRLPSRDFFKQTLFGRDFDVYFKSLFELMALDINNMHIRAGIRKVLHKIVDEVMYRAFCVREFEGGWSQTEHYQALPKAQQLWLDAALLEQKLEDDEWQEAIAKALRQWLAGEIEYRQNHIKLGDAEQVFLQAAIVEVLAEDKEYF
ncbi:MAG: type I-F CRISPR-associated protein Csy1 [Vitreoscilla sp.]|nr:type I-F CRISPR-associated protein Csy1 [Vitreoscilla sp.]MBP9540694.1 type I-F CRISPR-associated protein Csy1 [Vitreoscilla sp.]